MMKPISLIFTGLTVALALPAYADFGVGQRVPAPTATGQSVTSTPTAPFTWTPVTLPYGLNATGQMAVGGTVDATTRLSVNPQGTAENGLTVNMPSGATGNALQAKSSTGSLLYKFNNGGEMYLGSGSQGVIGVGTGGTATSINMVLRGGGRTDFMGGGGVNLFSGSPLTLYSPDSSKFLQLTETNAGNVNVVGGSATNGSMFFYSFLNPNPDPHLIDVGANGGFIRGHWDGYGNIVVNMNNPTGTPSDWDTTPALSVNANSYTSYTANLAQFSFGGVLKASIAPTGAVTAKGYASSVRVVTAADTAALTDSVLLVNGTFTETLPATGWPTGYRLTVKDTGTGTITLTAGGTVTFDGATTITFATQYKNRVLIWDGANFQVESGLL